MEKRNKKTEMKKTNLNTTKKAALENFEKGLEDNLEKIYKDQNGGITHFEKLERKKIPWTKRLLYGQILVLFLLLFAIGIIFFANNSASKDEESVGMEFILPEKISSGNVSEFIIRYENLEKFTLYDVEIILDYPESFEFLASEPLASNQFHTIWKAGDMVEGEEGEIRVKGKLIGEVGELVTLRSSVTYRPENFSSPFTRAFVSETSQITSSLLTIQIEGPDKVVPDQKITYEIRYANTSDNDLKNIRITAEYPSGFVFGKSDPAPKFFVSGFQDDTLENAQAQINNSWTIDELKKSEEGKITIEGILRNIEVSGSRMEVRIGIYENNEFTVYQKSAKDIEFVNHGLKLDIVVNNSKEDSSVNFGDTLNYSLVYKNLGQKTLYGVEISATLESGVVDWDTLIDKSFGVREKNTLTWKSATVPGLAILKPLDEGTIDFSVKLKTLNSVNVEKDDLKTQVRAQAKIGKIDDLEAQVSIAAEPRTSTINTDLQLRAEGRYFDDDNIAVGQGPLPPRVGEKTTFRIYWNLSNNLHEVTEVVVKTKLAADVRWEDKFLTSVGEVVYNPQDQSVTWKIVKIAPNKSFEDISAWFDFSITPKEDQEGKLVLLVTETSLAAKDSVTKSGISHLALSITTNLEDDPFGGGRGLVLEKRETAQ